MKISVRSGSLSAVADEAVVLLVGKGEDARRTVVSAGRPFGDAYGTVRARKAFSGDLGQITVLHAGADERIATLVLAGYGGGGAEPLRIAAASGLRAAREGGARSVTFVLPAGTKAWMRPDRAAEAVAEGAVVGGYRYLAHRTEQPKTGIEAVSLLAPRGGKEKAERGAVAGQAVGEAVAFARDLGNHPGNHATPSFLADSARAFAAEEGLKIDVLEEADMERLGMGALLGVTAGSAEAAKLIVLTYEPTGRGAKAADTVALVGKGLTFDSGGISIKPSPKMEDMKFDMCGGAAVLATMRALPRLAPKVRVVGLVPASENLPGGTAYKPGDILKAMNGVTIEVRNTDAEGRLILADALAYATTKLRPRPKTVIDLATLTGACVVALGHHNGGLLGNDDALAGRLTAAGEASGDTLWRLPLSDAYRKQLESPYADVSNLGSAGAGTITAAAFLEKFVGKAAWAHLDIAGTAWTERQDRYFTKGATGFGVRVLCRLLRDWTRGGGA